MGLGVTGAEVFNNATPGTVTNIDPSGPVQPGTTITVSYSKGPEMVAVPVHPAGASEADVQQAIQDAGLRWATGPDVVPDNKQDRRHLRQLGPCFRDQSGRRKRGDLPPRQGRHRLTHFSYQSGP